MFKKISVQQWNSGESNFFFKMFTMIMKTSDIFKIVHTNCKGFNVFRINILLGTCRVTLPQSGD